MKIASPDLPGVSGDDLISKDTVQADCRGFLKASQHCPFDGSFDAQVFRTEGEMPEEWTSGVRTLLSLYQYSMSGINSLFTISKKKESSEIVA
jgi:hypothetical protein